MRDSKGYRVDRLRRRRRTSAERWQTWILYTLAVIVAFTAVLGAWYFGAHLLGRRQAAMKPGYLALITLTGASGRPEAAALAVKDAADGSHSLFVIPRDLLLEGPKGEYVFAGDALAAGTLKQDLERVINAHVDVVYGLPLSTLSDLAGVSVLQVNLARPVKLVVAGQERVYEDGAAIPAGDVPALFAATGSSGEDAAMMQEALWRAALEAAAFRPDAERLQAAKVATAAASGAHDARYLGEALRGLTSRTVSVARVPSTPRVAEGQFAFVPDPEGIMAEITRKAPGYEGRAVVLVRNGTGTVGIGEAVRRRLSVLDVDLPPTANADSFEYRQTQILGSSRCACYTRPRRRSRWGRPAVRPGRGHRRRGREAQGPRDKGPTVAPEAETITAEELAREIVAGAAAKKAQDMVVLAMGDAVSYTDFFVVVSGANSRQTKAIAEDIILRLRPRRRPSRAEGEREGEWILIDYIDVVVHVFTPAARDFYRLETLWGDVPRLELPTQE
jgi:ribosome-associated protein